MTSYEIYTLFLCIIVFTVFTALFSIMISYMLNSAVKLIRCGADDELVRKEAERYKNKPSKSSVLSRVLSCALCIILAVIFAFSVFLSCTENDYSQETLSVKVVKSGSMERKNPKNTHLFENNLNDQVATFDLILTHPLPKESELELYDIVVYELDGEMILHRIVGIEEPNSKHPDKRYFLLQGDAVSTKDPFPVLYEQMHSVYRGERVPFIGSFIAFLQSPAGWLCIILVFFAIFITPLAERKLKKATLDRYEILIRCEDAVMASAQPKETLELTEEIITAAPEPKIIVKEKIVERIVWRTKTVHVPIYLPYPMIEEQKEAELPDRDDLVKIKVHYSPELTGTPRGKTVEKYAYVETGTKNETPDSPTIAPKTENNEKEIDTPNAEKAAETVIPDTIPCEPLNIEIKRIDRSLYEDAFNKMTADVSALSALLEKGERAKPAPKAKKTSEELTETELLTDSDKKSEAEPDTDGAVELVEAAAPNTEPQEIEEIDEAEDMEDAEESDSLFSGLRTRSNKTFREKLMELTPEMRKRYEEIDGHIDSYEPIRKVEGKKYKTYKSARIPIAKMTIRGKTLNTYVALDPKEYEGTKYVFTDESDRASYENYPMRMRLTSDRQSRWVRELIDDIARKNGIAKKEINQDVTENNDNSAGTTGSPFDKLKRKKTKSFRYRIRCAAPEVRARYRDITNHIMSINRARVISGKKSESYKCGMKTIAKLTVKGKTLNAYISLPPSEFENTKYIFTDAGEIKAYSSYPMRVKVTSDRQARWVKELIDILAARENLTKAEANRK